MPLTTTLAGGSALIKWLLRDEFTDTLAAGAVNGTPATPGPGTRTVVDTDGDALSISGGLLRFANPNAAFGDPGIWYDAVARVAGRLMAIRLTLSATNTIKSTGFDTNQSGGIGGPEYAFWNTGNIRVSGIPVSAYIAISYDLVVVVRAVGYYAFRKASTWVLDYVYGTSNSTPLYPAIITYNETFTADYIRIPDELYLPTPLAYDSFTRANGALGSTEATGPDGQTAPVHAWNNRVGTTQIAGNVASASALVGGIAIATVDTGTADVIAKTTLTRAGNEVAAIVRYVDADNYVRVVHDGTNCQLIKRVATAETTVITAAVAIGAGEIVVICEGTSFSLFLNNAKVGATSTINDAALQTGTEQGLFSTNVGNTQDAFLVMPRGTNGEYSALDRYSS